MVDGGGAGAGASGRDGGGGGTLQAIRYSRGSLELLDQRKLPHASEYLSVETAQEAWTAIHDMVVRGAPAIAIAAALTLAVEVVKQPPFGGPTEALEHIRKQLDYLVSSRPTAVNLQDAATKLKEVAAKAAANTASAEDVLLAYVDAAERMLEDDIAANKAIGKYGCQAMLEDLQSRVQAPYKVLTHCNTGSLATAGYGTALGVMRTLHSQGFLERVYCTETRPYNQGSRLTAYELMHDGIPATLIADSAAASLEITGGIHAVVVGADRIAKNGDTANKIGTYSLALSAAAHGMPFYIAAPLTSIDTKIDSGKEIVIEERTPKELTHSQGGHGPEVAPRGMHVWNPAFDVTPASLITAIITDKGVIRKGEGKDVFDISGFLQSVNEGGHSSSVSETAAGLLGRGQGYTKFQPLNENLVSEYLQEHTELASRLGKGEWRVREVGDGNVNFVYTVEGPSGALVLKQALPYLRCLGESWLLNKDRAFYEVSALKTHGKYCPEHAPEVYLEDRVMAITAMEYLKPPFQILRKGLIAGKVYPLLAQHMAKYMSSTLFHTSLLALSTTEHKAEVAKYCGNFEMCRLTELVIFTEPYMVAPNNRWTSPQLDIEVKSLREDDELKLAIAKLKAKFCERTQALLHGDLHTGSIMVTEDATQVIDPEFAYYGPMGFDVGAFIGNLLLAYFSQDGHATKEQPREEYKSWLLQTVSDTWAIFTDSFRSLWTNASTCVGDAYPTALYNTSNLQEVAQREYLMELFQDSMGFAGAKIIRRLVGVAHVEDMESIADPDIRATCERRALSFACQLVKASQQLGSIQSVLDLAESN
eukprot:SM000001S04448  [mRNA]  locus=s1:211856:217072:- [translate_table: standard]